MLLQLIGWHPSIAAFTEPSRFTASVNKYFKASFLEASPPHPT